MTKPRIHLNFNRAKCNMPEDLMRILIAGLQPHEWQRIKTEASVGLYRTLEDHALETVAGKPITLEKIRDDSVLYIGELVMERFYGDRGRWGTKFVVWESSTITEATLAFCDEAERRGLMPHENASRLRASVIAAAPPSWVRAALGKQKPAEPGEGGTP